MDGTSSAGAIGGINGALNGTQPITGDSELQSHVEDFRRTVTIVFWFQVSW